MNICVDCITKRQCTNPIVVFKHHNITTPTVTDTDRWIKAAGDLASISRGMVTTRSDEDMRQLKLLADAVQPIVQRHASASVERPSKAPQVSLEPIAMAKPSVRQPITPTLPAPRVPQPATQVIPDPRVPVLAGQPTIAPAPRVPIVGSPVRGIPLPRVLAPRPVSPPPSPRVRVDTTVTGTAPSNPPQSPVPVNPRTSQSAMPVGRHTGQTFSQCPAMNTRGRAP